MKVFRRAAVAALVMTASSLWAADPGVTFAGRGEIKGDSSDKSGLRGDICQKENPANCIPKSTLGGLGSALAYSGFDNVFLAFPDRGPFDGRTDGSYLDRFHFLHLDVDLSVSPSHGALNIAATLLDTRLLKSEGNENFVGDANAIDSPVLRFDPEGAAVSRDGTIYISDEYGPYINEFNRQGHLLRRIVLPSRYLISHPTGDADSAGNSFELYPTTSNPIPPGGGNDSGRQANRGMEGLTITPDGRYLVGIMQNALIQDNGLNTSVPPGRRGLNNRILKIDLLTGATQEFVYTLDAINQGRGVNDMLAINDHEFLVLERDNRSNRPTPPNDVQNPNLKRIYKIDLAKPGLSDVSSVNVLPENPDGFVNFFGPGKNLVAVTKTKFIDMLDPAYVVDSTASPVQTIRSVIAEKMEGMAWGPALPDGRLLLYVISDNDLYRGLPTQIYAFAIDPAAAQITFQRQVTSEPLFPPGQVKKLVP